MILYRKPIKAQLGIKHVPLGTDQTFTKADSAKYKALANTDIQTIEDTTLKHNPKGAVEYLHANHPGYNLYGDELWAAPEAARGHSTVVYNPQTFTSEEDMHNGILLDALSHGLREQDPQYQELLNALKNQFEYYGYGEDVKWDIHNRGGNVKEEYQQELANLLDGTVRGRLAADNPGFRRRSRYSSDPYSNYDFVIPILDRINEYVTTGK